MQGVIAVVLLLIVLCTLAFYCFGAVCLGYLDGKDRWVTVGAIGHIALTVVCLLAFGFTSYQSIVFLTWAGALLFGGVSIGYLDARPNWMAFGMLGWAPLTLTTVVGLSI
jgi:hypothetical protein